MSTVNPALIPPGLVDPARIAGPAAPPASGTTGRPGATSGPSFADVLSNTTRAAELPHFSRHAIERVQQRGIELSGPTLDRLAGGVASAAGKGSRNSVIFVDGNAFVVSVSNNTVVTAVDSEHMRAHVFTNIDSAVIA